MLIGLAIVAILVLAALTLGVYGVCDNLERLNDTVRALDGFLRVESADRQRRLELWKPGGEGRERLRRRLEQRLAEAKK